MDRSRIRLEAEISNEQHILFYTVVFSYSFINSSIADIREQISVKGLNQLCEVSG